MSRWTLFSVALHGLIVSAIAIAAPIAEKRRKSHRVEFVVATKPKTSDAIAPPATPPPPPPPVKVPPLLRPRRSLPSVVHRDIEMPPPNVPPVELPASLAPPTSEPPSAPPSFGVSMEATVQGPSSVAVPIGGTVMTSPQAHEPTRSGKGAPLLAPAAPVVTKLPELLREVQAPYPREARDAGIEGKVVMVVAVGADGRVKRARVVKGLGHGLDEAARDAMKQFVFRPGTLDGQPTEMEIRYSYTFVLEE